MSQQPARPPPGSHAAAAEDARQTDIPPQQPPADTGRATGDGDAPEPGHAQPGQEGTVPARPLVGVLRRLFVWLSLGNRKEGKKYQCHIVTPESPPSTGRGAPSVPPPPSTPRKRLTPTLAARPLRPRCLRHPRSWGLRRPGDIGGPGTTFQALESSVEICIYICIS